MPSDLPIAMNEIIYYYNIYIYTYIYILSRETRSAVVSYQEIL